RGHLDRSRYFGRRLHPAQRLCRRDNDAPRGPGHRRRTGLHHRNHPQEYPRPGHRPDDPGRRGRQENAGRPDGDAGADAAAGRDHYRRAADGGSSDPLPALDQGYPGESDRRGRLPCRRQRSQGHDTPHQIRRGFRSGGKKMSLNGTMRIALAAVGFLLAGTAMPSPDAAYAGSKAAVSTSAASQRIKLGLNKSVVVDLPADAYDILVANPAVADAVTRTSRRIYLFGKAVGQTNIFVFGANGEQIVSLDLDIERDVAGLEENLKRFIPGSNIRAELVNDNVVLTGTVETPLDAKRAVDLANAFVTGGEATTGQYSQTAAGGSAQSGVDINNPDSERQKSAIINLLQIIGDDQVTLKVTVAEVSRTVMKQLGVNLIAGGNSNGITWSALSEASYGLGKPLSASTVGIGTSLIDGYLNAMEQAGVMKTLAEPTLTAVSGEKATFKVGG